MDTPRTAPVTDWQNVDASLKSSKLVHVASVLKIVEINSDANRPMAMELMASIKYVFPESIMPFFARYSLTVERLLIVKPLPVTAYISYEIKERPR